MLSKAALKVLKNYYPHVEVCSECVKAWIEKDMPDFYRSDADVIKYVGDILYHSIIG